MPTRIRPSTEGTDLESTDGTYDAHVRLEMIKGDRYVTIDIFRSGVKNVNQAHVQSEAFQVSREGGRVATEYLKDFGFEVKVTLSHR